ncbi:S41 family peptidase [Rufibacter quisquiliarum]|uniref:Carboxyl-terminal processing protease n=2 Tax=Rufibacter TaxID=1379908 RepID=A0A839GM30_9BACT|nr:S41 family peptidase [Rufibacter quisquiliarum]MBA9079770.1 carboxyl-terminal processing protease [Rufibacter quisquiliarum]
MLKKSIAGLALVGTAWGLFSFSSGSERYFDIAKNLDIFATLFKEVNTYYVDDVAPSKLVRTGIDAMLKSLDPYTNYIPEDDIEDFRTMTTGNYGGIGALVGKRDGRTIISLPHEGSPAQKAGLIIGDEILKIDGVDLAKKNDGEVSKLLKGQAGTVVKLEIKRFGVEKPMVVDVTRANIHISNVPYYGLVTPEIGYLQLSGFTVDAGQEVRSAVVKLKEMGARKVILDLRDNPGGLLNEAVNISNLFLPRGKDIVSTKSKVSDWNKMYKALDEPLDVQMPLVVLTSSNSASAAEIVSGALQDYDRAVLIGERTFGKGLVQMTRPLSYNSQLKVTTAKYYIPSGRCIQAIDYAHRNADGSINKIPDSLRVAFKTSGGRVVYDGGGISPDVEVKDKPVPDIIRKLMTKNYIFDYATRFRAANPTIAVAKDFKLSDAEYQKFVAFLNGKDITYSTDVEKALDNMIKKAKEDKHFDEIKADVEQIKKKVATNKGNDLMRFKPEITELLEQEIVSRYYLQKGLVEATFNDDEDILAAVDVLNNSNRYQSLLSASAKK